jgi:hypothetical protein
LRENITCNQPISKQATRTMSYIYSIIYTSSIKDSLEVVPSEIANVLINTPLEDIAEIIKINNDSQPSYDRKKLREAVCCLYSIDHPEVDLIKNYTLLTAMYAPLSELDICIVKIIQGKKEYLTFIR